MIRLNSCLLSTAYLPPVQYCSKFLIFEKIYIEKQESYQKQSFRNRCYIYGANGRQCLVIPVIKHHAEKIPISLVEIDYQSNWHKIHLKSIESAYRLSAFYEYYIDDFKNFYTGETRLLFDWNLHLLKTVLRLLGIQQEPLDTEKWEKNPENSIDFRQTIHPKDRLVKPDRNFDPIPYQQVFQDRYGFIANLSIIDLLFNEGPQALDILKKTVGSMK